MGEPIAAHVLARHRTVIGVDAAPSMIARCQARFPDAEWIVADMRGLDLGRTFDGILAWDSFFHLTAADQREMFEVFSRHAHTGTRLMFTSGNAYGEAMASITARRSITAVSRRTSTRRCSRVTGSA